MTDVVDMVNHPPHYNAFKYECKDFTNWLQGPFSHAFKYMFRAGLKGDEAQHIEDRQKAKFWLHEAITCTVQITVLPEAVAVALNKRLVEMANTHKDERERFTTLRELVLAAADSDPKKRSRRLETIYSTYVVDQAA
ncbi:hypothetical protein ACPV5S_15585 [Vibrio astriarenae]